MGLTYEQSGADDSVPCGEASSGVNINTQVAHVRSKAVVVEFCGGAAKVVKLKAGCDEQGVVG